jgi:H+-transporting ATPase
MAAKWHEPPRDALDTLTLTAVVMPSMDAVEQLSYKPFDPIVKRTDGKVREIATVKVFETTKGAPHVILKLAVEGRSKEATDTLTEQVEQDVHQLGLRGIRSLAVAKTNEAGQWEFLIVL